MKAFLGAAVLAVCIPLAVSGQTVKGQLTANGLTGPLSQVAAYEVDSPTERGLIDVVVLLSDRKLPRGTALNTDKLGELMLSDNLVALRVVFDPQGKVKSAAPFHPALKSFIQSGAFVKWKPSAFTEKEIGGRLFTHGDQQFAGQRWRYDITFLTPIVLDPNARTMPPSNRSCHTRFTISAADIQARAKAKAKTTAVKGCQQRSKSGVAKRKAST